MSAVNSTTVSTPWTFSGLLAASPAELEHILATGEAPSAEGLAGWEFRGANHPWFAKLLGIQKFVKGFFATDQPGLTVEGYNCPVVQDGFARPWRTKPLDREPKRFGFYSVYPVRPQSRDHRFPKALLLDYGHSRRNPRLDPTRLLRDYLVRVHPGSDELLLGKADLALGSLRIPVSYFLLERLRPHSFRG